jgi:hypothetical protein
MISDTLSIDQLRNVFREQPQVAGRFLRELSQPELEQLFERWLVESRMSREALADELQQMIAYGDDAL